MLNKYRRAFCAIIIGLLPIYLFGQNSTSSPYSYFGVGDLAASNFGRNNAMGGVASPLISPFNLNPANPATYAALLPNTFIFEVGLKLNNYKLSTPDENFSKLDGNISYVAAGFSIAKWWKAGIGLLPVSSVGYTINELKTLELENNYAIHTYKGEGGINNFYLDNSFVLLKSLSLGVKAGYTFGSLDRTKIVQSIANTNSTTTSVITDTRNAVFDAVSVGFGLHYHKLFKEDYFLNVGATYNLKTKLEGTEERLITSEIYLANQNSLSDILVNEPINKGSIDFPVNYSIGASLLFKQKIEFAVDYKVEKWTETEFFKEKQNFQDNARFAAGVEYTPDYSSTKYFKLIRFRAGFNHTNSYLMVNDKQLVQTGGSFGVGLPLRSGAVINLAILYDKRTIPGEDLLTERFLQLQLNLSLRASWFHKYKYE